MTVVVGAAVASGCGDTPESAPAVQDAKPASEVDAGRKYLLERVDDAAVAQLYADGFEALPLREKTLIWHLYQAAIAGRDIYYDQRYRHNLEMREVLEQILTHAGGIDQGTLDEIRRYTKLFWLNTGPYNNLTARKFVLKTTPDAFAAAARQASANGATFPLAAGETLDAMLARMRPLFFDLSFDPIVTNKTPGEGKDKLAASANNLYTGVTEEDLTGFTEKYGAQLAARQARRDARRGSLQTGRTIQPRDRARHGAPRGRGRIRDRADGARAQGARQVVSHRRDRRSHRVRHRLGPGQRLARRHDQRVHRGLHGPARHQGLLGGARLLCKPARRPRTSGKCAEAAQWFEDRMPWDPKYRKPGVQGITANAIDVVIETGDSGPITPVGINLPNDQAIREKYGSKSVSLSNVSVAYDKSTAPEFRREFAWSDDEVQRAREVGQLLRRAAHEPARSDRPRIRPRIGAVEGLASGGAEGAVLGARGGAGRSHRAVLPAGREAGRAGILEASDQQEIVRTQYESYARNAVIQLRRVREGTQIEEDHMRNRQMIVRWLMANTKAIEVRTRDAKTYYVMVDAKAFRDGAGKLLGDVQRIKAEGDYPAAKAMFETHGIHFDAKLRDEIVERVDRLKMPSYSGFVQPRLQPVTDSNGKITDVQITYPQDLTQQMLEYSGKRTPPTD